MGIDALLAIVLAGVNNAASLAALYAQVKAEGRTDLTPEEVNLVRAKAVVAVDALQAQINAAP
jgi:hypothetical protein